MTVAARQQESRFEKKLREIGLTRVFWCVLLAVGSEELTQPSLIADFIGIDRTATSRALRQLEELGLVQRSPLGGDRRRTAVRLTGAGQAALRRATELAQDNARQTEARLTAEELRQLRRLLDKLRDTAAAPLRNL